MLFYKVKLAYGMTNGLSALLATVEASVERNRRYLADFALDGV